MKATIIDDNFDKSNSKEVLMMMTLAIDKDKPERNIF